MSNGSRLRDEDRWFRTKRAMLDVGVLEGSDIDWCRQWQGHCIFVELKQVSDDWQAYTVPVTQYLLLRDLTRLGTTLLVLHVDEHIEPDSLLWVAEVSELPEVDWKQQGVAVTRNDFVPSTGATFNRGTRAWDKAASDCACGGLFARSADSVCQRPRRKRDDGSEVEWFWPEAFWDDGLHPAPDE